MSTFNNAYLSAETNTPVTGQQHMAFLDRMFGLLDKEMESLDSIPDINSRPETSDNRFPHPPLPSMISIINSLDELTITTKPSSTSFNNTTHPRI